MALTNAESAAYTRLRKTSGSGQAVPLTDDAVRVLVFITARDLGVLDRVDAPAGHVPELYDPAFHAAFRLAGPDPKELFERLIRANAEAETFVSCLAVIHKARLKYQQVLSTQPFASMDQVAPRGLLQYGQTAHALPLAAFLVWRKWLYDLDNRAAQDTGYLFEPVIAGAIGGVPCSAKSSPITRAGGGGGRQVDCLKDDRAYEIKIRITIAASGQGRWGEELSFPTDARASGLVPVLVVLDPTPNPKLRELLAAFERNGGETYVGDDAWVHLRTEAGAEMGQFLEKYVHAPLDEIYFATDDGEPLPALTLTDRQSAVDVTVGGTSWSVPRSRAPADEPAPDVLPDDVGDFLPGFR